MNQLVIAANAIASSVYDLDGLPPGPPEGDYRYLWGHLQIVNGFGPTSEELEVQSWFEDYPQIPYFAYPAQRNHYAGTDFAANGNPETYKAVTIDVGARDPGEVWSILSQVHSQFVLSEPDFFYSHVQNSNSYVNTLLWTVGIDASQYLGAVTPTLVDAFPGVARNILTDGMGALTPVIFDLDITTTTGHDYFRTGDGNDKISGLDGDDTLKAGEGFDTIVGGKGADEIDGGDGIDVISFANAEPITVVFGPFSFTIGVEINLTSGFRGEAEGDTYHNIEAALGSDYKDVFQSEGEGGIFAGGEGDDVFEINAESGANGPAVVWGGAGGDIYNVDTGGVGGILVAHVDNLTEENFQYFDYEELNVPYGFNWNEIDVIILNPDSSDLLAAGPTVVGTGSSTIGVTSQFHPGPSVLFDTTHAKTSFADEKSYEHHPDPQVSADYIGQHDVSFLGGGAGTVYASVATVSYSKWSTTRFQFEDPHEAFMEDYPDFGPPEEDALFTYNDPNTSAAFDTFAWFGYFYEQGGANYRVDNPGEIGVINSIDDIGSWFLVGASLFGSEIVSSKVFSGSIEVPTDPTPPRVREANSNTVNYAVTAEGIGTTKTYSGFNPATDVLLLDGSPINPAMPGSGVTVSQSSNDILLQTGNGDIVLESASLTVWLGSAASYAFGSYGNDIVQGTSLADVLSSGAGNDVLNGLDGNDTIAYAGGDDTIDAGTGNDTLDLSQYSADQVSFSLSGQDVIVKTAFGWITLVDQALHAVGSTLTNVETIEFDGSQIDDASIRFRAATDGDDVLEGTSSADTIDAGYGHDIISGLDGDDALFGGAGNDSISGGSGNDTIEGGEGKDWVDLGDGNDRYIDTAETGPNGLDTVTGGLGADTFVFGDIVSEDVITDFELGVDTLELSSVLVAGRSAQQVVTDFATVNASGVLIEISVGQSIILEGLATTTGLENDIQFTPLA